MRLTIKAWAAGIGLIAFCHTVPAKADTLAECGASKGQAYFFLPGKQGWEDDQITGGTVKFVSDSQANLNVIFIDARGGTIDAAADGAEIALTRVDGDTGEFSVLVVYPKTGVTESYNVLASPDGSRKLLWTSSKARIGDIGFSKVGAYTADCR